MPTIAQKLCHELVEPVLAPSSNGLSKKPTKSIVIEKKKVISQLEPTSRTVMSKFKSRDSIRRKDFSDAAVNTLISGPLRCDNNCITNVRRRDNPCGCKHKKINQQTCSKQIQTLNRSCSQSDKACAHCINTANCGTQFMENLRIRLRNQISNRLLLQESSEFEPQFSYRYNQHVSNSMSRSTKFNQNGKRWALSSYPIRGPDF